MVKHIVLFRFKGDATARKSASIRFRDALLPLPGIIAELKTIEVGINENPNELFDLALTATADSLADVATYSAHPAHVAAVNTVRAEIESRACVDYSTH